MQHKLWRRDRGRRDAALGIVVMVAAAVLCCPAQGVTIFSWNGNQGGTVSDWDFSAAADGSQNHTWSIVGGVAR